MLILSIGYIPVPYHPEADFRMLAAVTVNEFLLLAKRGIRRFRSAIHDFKACTKFIIQALWTITYHLQPRQ